MIADDFVAVVDGVAFEENGRIWTLEVADVDDSSPERFTVTVEVLGTGADLLFDVPRDRPLDSEPLRDHVVGLARDLVIGRQKSGLVTEL
ncbi:MAG TPA: hypothetical protein VH583_25855 [Vicinamibacterales bacterium]|jgi:hypothetical protein